MPIAFGLEPTLWILTLIHCLPHNSLTQARLATYLLRKGTFSLHLICCLLDLRHKVCQSHIIKAQLKSKVPCSANVVVSVASIQCLCIIPVSYPTTADGYRDDHHKLGTLLIARPTPLRSCNNFFLRVPAEFLIFNVFPQICLSVGAERHSSRQTP